MVSFGAKVFKFIVNASQTLSGKSFVEMINESNGEGEKPTDHKFKKGYKATCKETANKSRYIIIQKETDEPIKKIVYFIHGGAYRAGLSNMYYDLSYMFCDLKDDLAVVLLDYSLIPEFKHPTQHNEALDVWNALITEHKPEDIIVAGDSSGAHCSLVLIQRLAKENKELPKAAFFISAMSDYTFSGKSIFSNYQKDPFFGKKEPPTEEVIEKLKNEPFFRDYYENEDPKDTTISPKFWDYTTFPKKSLFFVGGDEMLLDDTLTIVEKLKNNGFETECVIAEGLFHCYVIGTTWIAEVNESQNKIKSFILENLY